MSTNNEPFEEFNLLIQSISQDKQDLKESAVRSLEIASKLLQVDPNDTTARDAVELAKRMINRPWSDYITQHLGC